MNNGKKNYFDSLYTSLRSGSISGKTPGEILMGVALGIDGYSTPTFRTLYRSHIITADREAEKFRKSLLKIDGTTIKPLADYDNLKIVDYSNFYKKLHERTTLECFTDRSSWNLEIKTLEDLLGMVESTAESSMRHITGNFSFYSDDSPFIMVSKREKGEYKCLSKVSTNLAMAYLHAQGSDLVKSGGSYVVKSCKNFKQKATAAFEKAKIEDFTGLRVICPSEKEISNLINTSFRLQLGSDGFKALIPEEISKKYSGKRERSFWKDSESVRDVFFQNRSSGYRGWKFKLIKKLSQNNPALHYDSNRFEFQIFTFEDFLNNETKPGLRHCDYDSQLEAKIEAMPEKVFEFREKMIERLHNFYNNVECYIDEQR